MRFDVSWVGDNSLAKCLGRRRRISCGQKIGPTLRKRIAGRLIGLIGIGHVLS